jgi:hypothetical protein
MKAILITVSDINPVTQTVTYDLHRDDPEIDKDRIAKKMNLMIEEIIKIMNDENSILNVSDLKQYVKESVERLEDENTLIFEHPGLFLLMKILEATHPHSEINFNRDKLIEGNSNDNSKQF